MKITFLGTNGWYDTRAALTACALIQTKNAHIVLDAGMGIYKIKDHIRDNKPISLFLSHFHLDHLYGLHTLNLFNFPQGIDIYGPAGIKRHLGGLLRRPFTKPLEELPTKVRLHDLSREGTPRHIDMEYGKLNHAVLCYGYRFQLEKKIVAYCTDTGWCDNLVRLAAGADLFIAECSFKPGQTSAWGHLNPGLAAAAAQQAEAKRLALMHFDAARYGTARERRAAQQAARRIFKNAFVAFDDTAVRL